MNVASCEVTQIERKRDQRETMFTVENKKRLLTSFDLFLNDKNVDKTSKV